MREPIVRVLAATVFVFTFASCASGPTRKSERAAPSESELEASAIRAANAATSGPMTSTGASEGESGFAPLGTAGPEQVLAPLGREAVVEFLATAARSEEASIRADFAGPVKFEKPSPKRLGAVFILRGRYFQIYLEDLNHDGREEYLIVYLPGGRQSRSGIYAVYDWDGTKLVPMEEKNLTALNEVAHSQYQLDSPFVVQINGARFLRMIDRGGVKHSFLWEGVRLTDVHF